MRKLDIATRIHREARISEDEAATLLEWILELLKTTLQKGEPITIPGFGKFTVRSKAPRTGLNFRTGESIVISARKVVTFHSSPLLTKEMNSVQAERQEAVTRTG
jgi:integration host factor subunit alpha